jgi:polysaccharide pyruvyl transferase CsaB
MTKAILCGYYGQGNSGDEALLASLLQMLPDAVTPIVLSGNPKITEKRHGVTSCSRASAFTILAALRQSDCFIWGGGSLMQDASSWRNPVYYGGLMALAQQQGLQTIAWAQGIGPLNYGSSRWIARQALAGCNQISVRDRASAQLLTDWNLPFTLAPDPVWALESKPCPGLWDLSAPRVAVCLRSHRLLTPHRLDLFTQALISFQKSTDTCILLVPFQPSQDSAIAQTIASQLPGDHAILSPEDPRELKGLFRGVEMVIGMRLHSLIMAAAAECRCFALSYDPKVTQLVEQLHLPSWDLTSLPDDPTLMSKTWLNHYVNGDALTPDQIHSLRDRARIHQELLATLAQV